MMDYNFKRRKRERAFAQEVADAFLQATNASEPAPANLLVSVFAGVCEQKCFAPDDAAIGRILHYANENIVRRDRDLGRILEAMDKVSP